VKLKYLHLLDPGLVDIGFERIDFFVEARPGIKASLRPGLEAGFVEFLLHVRDREDFDCFRLKPLENFGRRLGRRYHERVS
jgi:hypothetical protein